MKSTMQDGDLSVSRLLRYGSTVHGRSTCSTWTTAGPRRATYAEVGAHAAQLAHALRELGVDGDQRVGTFMFNNQEHLETYYAVPSMGAVLHTVNIRLFPEQVTYVVNHAEDRVVVVDATLVPVLGRVLADLKTVEHVIVAGPGADVSAVEAPPGGPPGARRTRARSRPAFPVPGVGGQTGERWSGAGPAPRPFGTPSARAYCRVLHGRRRLALAGRCPSMPARSS